MGTFCSQLNHEADPFLKNVGGVLPIEIAQQMIIQISDGIPTKELDELVTKYKDELITKFQREKK